VKNPKHSPALQEWLAADERLFRAHQKIRATFLETEFGPEAEPEKKSSRPCINVTPPKQPPKK
jgi:hypothetical protein